ncbi:MAG: hypothetical protein FIA95_15725 [Gemmatimonadetes bacterium]|nr:hypothetical protein [Gemmatimonadota bacterium]
MGRIPRIRSLVAVLLATACGTGGQSGDRTKEWATLIDSLPTPTSLAGAPPSVQERDARVSESLGLLTRARVELEAVPRLLASGAAERAGAALTASIRALEDGMTLAGTGITPRAAEEFETARRSADRWRAGEPPSREAADRILRGVRDECEALAWARGAR